eukprot:673872-Rhodomonas_salina.2
MPRRRRPLPAACSHSAWHEGARSRLARAGAAPLADAPAPILPRAPSSESPPLLHCAASSSYWAQCWAREGQVRPLAMPIVGHLSLSAHHEPPQPQCPR